MKGTMKMVRAGPSTYYSDAIVKHFSPVSSGFVTWIFHRIRGTMWFFSISICKMFLIHLLPGFSLWVSASFWDGMLLKWWFLEFTSILCYLKKWAELQMPINRVCDNLYRNQVLMSEERFFGLIERWLPWDPSSSSPSCVTLGDNNGWCACKVL